MVSPALTLFDRPWRSFPFGRAYRLAIAHAIERDSSIAQFHEVRDLVAPAERQIGEAMDQDDCALGLPFWQSFEVVFVARTCQYVSFRDGLDFELNVGGKSQVFTYATYARRLPQSDSAPSRHQA